MTALSDSFLTAWQLVALADAKLASIVLLSLRVSLAATMIACIVGMPIGALLAVGRFPGRRALIVLFNGLMGLPPVVVGLLFSPGAMIIAQAILVTPIVAAMTRQVVADAWSEYREQLRSLGASRTRAAATLLWDGRFSLSTAALAGFGRAIAEVGAVMIVGGNIDGVTRVMTTTIALETSKGDLPLALALGFILIAVVLALNAVAYALRGWAERRWG